ncbi:DUF4349 domain-containing protein [Microbacterium sp. MAHUQ-60]|uniref:DUF4349 domain-containing protein n=1 Tax=unclassified Microbacterium TaxID=2609290 RepID=UPI003616D696
MSENTGIALPPLSDESIARIESAVFDEIGEEAAEPERRGQQTHRVRRRWVTGLSIAAAFVVGALITPPLISVVSAGQGAADSAADGVSTTFDGGPVPAIGQPEIMRDAGGAVGAADEAVDADRDIITTSQLTLRVGDVAKAADAIADLAAAQGGYVESTDLGLAPGAPIDSTREPSPDRGEGWISIRVPAAKLSDAMRAAEAEGQVLGSSISRQDVTSTAVDLRARVGASRASVQRLTELMSKSGSVADLIAAESALSERQAQLESYEQQLKSIDEQVAMSSIRIQLTERPTATTADPAGFADGLLAGWNGLIISLNALVVAFGFLLPWLAIAGVALLVIWLIRRRRHRTAP